jgi:ribosomal-protein-alanine N-acetyltransferase
MEEKIIINDLIVLTEFRLEDKSNLVRYLNDPVIYLNTLTIPKNYTEADADKWLEITQANLAKHGRLTNWAIRHRETGLIGGIGRMALTGMEGHRDEIGYWLAAPFRGQGIMTEVVRKLSGHLFSSTPLVRIEAHVYEYNPASARLLEKAGFQREGLCRKFAVKDGQYIDAILLAKIKE